MSKRKAQRRTQLSEEERSKRLQSFYEFLYKTPKECTIILNYDEIPASLAGLLGNVQTLDHRGTENVMVAFNEQHFKRMGTLIASLAVRKMGNAFEQVPIKPAIIIKQASPKVVANPHGLLVSTTPTGVISGDYMKDQFIPDLQAQLQALGGKALVVMDSASAHLSVSVLKAFQRIGCHCAVIPGGLTMFVQSIDTALASKYRKKKNALKSVLLGAQRTTASIALLLTNGPGSLPPRHVTPLWPSPIKAISQL